MRSYLQLKDTTAFKALTESTIQSRGYFVHTLKAAINKYRLMRQISPKYSYSVLIAPVLAESEYNFLLAQKKLIQRVYKQNK